MTTVKTFPDIFDSNHNSIIPPPLVPTAASSLGLVTPPPDVRVPQPPSGFIATNPNDYRGFRPKKAELAVVTDAVRELHAFSNYGAMFGMTAPPADHVAQALHAAGQWSSLLALSVAWVDYVRSLEGMAWKDTLGLIDRLKAPFDLASRSDPTLVSKYPSLARLLGTAKAIARRAASTKKRKARDASAAKLAAGGEDGVSPVAPTVRNPASPFAPQPA
jgi:hypothetical protein